MWSNSYSKNWFYLAVLLLIGCSSSQNASIMMFDRALGLNNTQATRSFNPSFQYMRITSDGRVFYLVKGYQDNGIDVWYGASGETLRFKDGRFAGASGLLTEWRNVIIPTTPTWADLVSGTSTYRWTRKRDLMPGYHYGIEDELAISRIPPPINSNLAGLPPEKLIWLEENNLSQLNQLPPARYAYDSVSQTVVYGDTCLSSTFCFSWQSWPKSLQ